VSLFFTETLTVLFVTSYVVEFVFNIPGVGQMALQAIQARDPAPLLAGAFLPVYLGLLGSFAQDVLYTWLDPRIEYGESAA
jgi:peptide/nickel transport system permease protein